MSTATYDINTATLMPLELQCMAVSMGLNVKHFGVENGRKALLKHILFTTYSDY